MHDHDFVGPYVAAHGARIGPRCVVGPFAFLRPGTVLHERSSVGRFVELKGAEIGIDSKVPHLSYLGDVTVGEGRTGLLHRSLVEISRGGECVGTS